MRFLHFCLALLACLSFGAGAAGFDAEPAHFPRGQVLVDPEGRLTPDQALDLVRAGTGTAFDRDARYPTQGRAAVWFLLDAPVPSQPGPAVLTLPFPQLDSAQAFLLAPPGQSGWQVQVAGDALSVAQWTHPDLYPVFHLPSGMPPQLLLRVQNFYPVSFPWRLHSSASFANQHQTLVLGLGVYLGLAVLVVVLGLANAALLRDPVYALYAAYVVALTLTQCSLTGLGGLFLWPRSAFWNDLSAIFLSMVSAALLAGFVRSIVRPLPYRWLGWVLWAYMGTGLLLSVLLLLLGRGPALFLVVNLYFLASFPVCCGVLVWFARSRAAYGWWLVAGLLALLAGALLVALRNLGFLPNGNATQYGAQIGAALEIPLLMIGLYHRSRFRRDSVVRRVALQTQDPVTGLANDRVTRERLDHAVRRLRAEPGRACMMRLRVSNFDAIISEHGPQVAGVAIVQAARCLGLITREGDTVGRLADGDFVLILEQSLNEGQAMAAAARVVARGLAYTSSLPGGTVIKFHVALSLSAHEAADGESLLAALGGALSAVAVAPGKAIRLVSRFSFSAPAFPAGLPATG